LHLDLLIGGGHSKPYVQTDVLSCRQLHLVDYGIGETFFGGHQTEVSWPDILEQKISRGVTGGDGIGILIRIV
jgi:hypothetical protein